jgi:hypothetical protein
MRQIFVLKDVNYGSNKNDTAVNTALTPDDLADGAIGIYGIDPVTKALVLITDAAGGAGTVQASAYKGKDLYIYQGTVDGARRHTSVPVNNIDTLTSQKFTASVKGVTYIGHNPITGVGSLNTPAVINRGDEAQIKVNNLNEVEGGTTIGRTYSGYATVDNASDYEIMVNMVDKNIYVDDDRIIEAEIVSDLTGGAALTNDANVVYGSKNVTSTAHGLDVGDYVVIEGATYKVTVSNANDFVLDRPYRGATATVLAADILDQGNADPTEIGLRVTDKFENDNLAIQNGFAIQSANNVKQVASQISSGSYSDINGLEIDFQPHRGQLDNRVSDRIKPQPNTYAVVNTNYDMYTINAGEKLSNSDHMGKAGVADNESIYSFVTGVADTAGKNQSDFEDIMEIFYPDFVTLF